MTIRHHLSDPLLMAHAAGQLPEAFALLVSTHVSMCDECRVRLEAFEAVGGAMLDRCGTETLDEGSLDACFARIAGLDAAPRRPAPPRKRSIFPAPLNAYVGGDLDKVKWRPVGMGVRQAVLRTSRGASARLLYIPAGKAVPDHGHRGMELTLVLQGAFRDESDRFGPGDVEIADQAVKHTPVAEDGADCICLAVTDAPLRFSGLIPRLAQPFVRI
jgi:putative transcriptional regulator